MARIFFTPKELEVLVINLTQRCCDNTFVLLADEDKNLIKKLKRALLIEGMDDEYEGFLKPIELGEKKELDDEELEIRKRQKEISDPSGIFECPKCKVRTNQKTPTTSCVICNTSLWRVGTI